jgi:hypothetical protein
MKLTTEELLALQLRRRSFELALADPRVRGAIIALARDDVPFLAVCPCCGYPTLSERGGYDICPICYWEDDGQDDETADPVLGGPNSDYSLTEARRNFIDGGTQYRASADAYADEMATAVERRRIVDAYDALLPVVDSRSFVEALPFIGTLHVALRSASSRRIAGRGRIRHSPTPDGMASNTVLSPRPLSARETALLNWCADSLSEPDRSSFKTQIPASRVSREEGGHVDFEVPDSLPPVAHTSAINLNYEDPDGMRVDFIVSFVAGRLSWIDRYRVVAATR